jgi:hypothetical protein
MLSFFVCFFLGKWVAKRRAIYCNYTCSMCIHRCRHIAYAGGILGTIALLNIIIAVDLDTIFRRVCMGLVCIFYSSWIRFDSYSYSWVERVFFFFLKLRGYLRNSISLVGCFFRSFSELRVHLYIFFFGINKSLFCPIVVLGSVSGFFLDPHKKMYFLFV